MPMETRLAPAIAVNTMSEPETAEVSLHRVTTSPEDLLARLERANQTIRTLERRVAMQEKNYAVAMQEKNRKIRELLLILQSN
jgi:flagellar biosynthesis/type III secretory pathway chaperone